MKNPPSMYDDIDTINHMSIRLRDMGMVEEAKEMGRNFFRQDKTVDDIFSMAEQPFEPYKDQRWRQMTLFDDLLDVGSGCGESCEIGADE